MRRTWDSSHKTDNKHLLNGQKREKEYWCYLLIAVTSKLVVEVNFLFAFWLFILFLKMEGTNAQHT